MFLWCIVYCIVFLLSEFHFSSEKFFLIFSMRCGICLSVIEKLISSKQGLGKIVWCGLMLVSQLMSRLHTDRCHPHQPIRAGDLCCGPMRGRHLSHAHLAQREKKLQYLFYIRRKLGELALLAGRSQNTCSKDCQTFQVILRTLLAAHSHDCGPQFRYNTDMTVCANLEAKQSTLATPI